MKLRAGKALLLIYTLLLSSASEAKSCPPAELDAVLATHRIGGVTEFLASPETIEAYFQALVCVMGESRMPRPSFDAILKQLRDLVNLPEGELFAKRLWQTDGLGKPFHIAVEHPSFGRNIRGEAGNPWKEAFKQYLDGLRDASQDAPRGQTELRKRLVERFAELRKETAELPEYRFFAAMRKDPQVKRLVQADILRRLREPVLIRQLDSHSAEVVLNTLKLLKEKPKTHLGSEILQEFPELLSVYEASLKSEKDWIKQGVFPEGFRWNEAKREIHRIPVIASSSHGVDFVPASRRFHTIFRGPYVHECVGGACEHLEKLTPKRWALAAIEDAQVHWVMNNGEFHGFTQVTPVSVPGKKAPYGSFEIGSFDLGALIAVRDPATDALKETSMFALWQKEWATQSKPVTWGGLIKSSSDDFHNAGALPSVYRSNAYQFGEKITTGPLSTTDPRMEKWLKTNSLSVISAENDYPTDHLWSDATSSRVVRIQILKPEASSQLLDPKFLDQVANEILASRSGEEEFKRSLSNLDLDDIEIQRWIGELCDRLDLEHRRRLMQCLFENSIDYRFKGFQFYYRDPKLSRHVIETVFKADLDPGNFFNQLRCTDPELAETLQNALIEPHSMKSYHRKRLMDLMTAMPPEHPRVRTALFRLQPARKIPVQFWKNPDSDCNGVQRLFAPLR